MNLFQKQQNSSGYDSIPNAITTDDATAAAVPFGTTLGQRSKRMIAIAAGLLLVTGGAAVWLQQEEGSYFRSSGGSLATEDGSITTDVMLAELGSETIALQEELALTLLDEQSSPARCTEEGNDPWSTRQHVDCCAGLDEVKGNWNPTGEPSYRCVNSTPTPTSDSPCQAKCEVRDVDEEYACGDTRKTLVCYPTDATTGQVPVVFYNRDSNGWKKGDLEQGSIKWLKKMAAQCLITIAPETSNAHTLAKNCTNDHDSALAFEFLSERNGWEQWNIQVAVNPDWSKIAAAGQSSGAHHIPRLQKYMGETHGIRMKAVLYGHGGSLDNNKQDLIECLKGTWCDNVSAMFLTATNDGTVYPAWTLNWYTKLTSTKRVQNAVYAEVKMPTGDPHMEPVLGKGVFNDYTARFLACHLYKGGKKGSEQRKLSKAACAWIYGEVNGKKNICDSKAVGNLDVIRHLFDHGNTKC